MELLASRGLERAATAVCGLVPLAGLAFFGWDVPTVIFTLWLDAYLASLRMIPANLYLINQDLVRDPKGPKNRVLDLIGGLGLATVMWAFLALPVTIAYQFLNILVSQVHRGGLEAVGYDVFFDAPWSVALLAGGRLFQCAREFFAIRAAGASRFGDMLKAEYGLLFCKSGVLFALASLATLFGLGSYSSRGEMVFVVAAIIGLVAIEWYADYWLHRVSPPDPRPALQKKLEVVHGFDARSDRL
jgi:hypothetical protein